MPDEIDSVTDKYFSFSGNPKSIYAYKCFHDPSNPDWLHGNEYFSLDEKEYITDSDTVKKSKERWNFFYRPYDYTNLIAPEQKKQLLETKNRINNAYTKRNIALILSILALFLFIWMLVVLPLEKVLLSTLPIASILALLIKFHFDTMLIEKLKTNEHELTYEIRHLENQHDEIHKKRISKKEIQRQFWDDIKSLEKDLLTNELRRPLGIESSTIYDFYKNVEVRSLPSNYEYPSYPVIPTWGVLQPTHDRSTGLMNPGIRKITRTLGSKAATWRTVTKDEPFFRLWNITFLFFGNKSLDVVSFHYDFITQKRYGRTIETYYYNHIANCSFELHDMNYEDKHLLINNIKLPKSLSINIFNGEAHKLSFSSSGRKLYQCILPGEETIEGMLIWAAQREKEIETEEIYKTTTDPKIIQEKEEELQNIILTYDELYSNLASEALHVLRKKTEEFSLQADTKLEFT